VGKQAKVEVLGRSGLSAARQRTGKTGGGGARTTEATEGTLEALNGVRCLSERVYIVC